MYIGPKIFPAYVALASARISELHGVHGRYYCPLKILRYLFASLIAKLKNPAQKVFARENVDRDHATCVCMRSALNSFSQWVKRSRELVEIQLKPYGETGQILTDF